MNTPAKLRPDGLAYKLREFFDANPDEELTMRDVMTRFDIDHADTVRNALRKLERTGAAVERVEVIRPKAKGRMQ